MFPKAPVRNENLEAMVPGKTIKTKRGVPNRITIRKMFNAERKSSLRVIV